MKKLFLALLLVLFVPVFARAQTYTETLYTTGLSMPVSMAFTPDGRIFVAEKSGKLKVIKKDGTVATTPSLILNVSANSERGLLGVALDPNFSTNRYIYLYYTKESFPVKNRLSRFTVSASNPDQIDTNSEKVLIDDIASDAGNHNGGAVHFGKDGKLYVAVGDGGQFSSNGQALNTLSGKILRINSDGTIPTDNPFFNVAGAKKEIWAYGFRNPFTFAVDPVSGMIHVNDVGQSTWEEVNMLEKGGNYGWPICEGAKNTGVGDCINNEFKYPVHTYNHSGAGKSITAGVFFKGDYYFGDYVGNFIKKISSANVVSDFVTAKSPIDMAVSPDGNLYYLSLLSGKIFRLSPDTRPVNGQCAVIVNTCTTGTLSDTADSATNALWSCVGSSGGTTATCSTAISNNKPPVTTITSPIVNTKYNAGQTITITGTGVDPEDGNLPASAFSWTVVFHHDTHTHPFLGPITGKSTDTFVIPTVGEISDNVWYRIYLTTTDSKGAKTEVYRDIYPNVVNLTFRTAPPGFRVIVDGQPQFTPYTIKSVVGMTRNINISDAQLDNNMYLFNSWSDNKPRNHDISTPNVDTAYTATLNQIKPESITFNPYYGSGDIAVHMQKEIDDRIAGVLAGLTTRSIWYTRGSDTAAWEGNPNIFTSKGRALDLSGQSPWNSIDQYKRSGTLVSPRHLIFAKHFPLRKDSTVVFVNSNNEIITRTVTKVEVSPTNDLGVALIDRDVPETIPFYPVIPRSTWEQYLKGIYGNTPLPIIYLNQNDRVGVRVVKAASFYNGSINMYHEKGSGKRAEFDDPVVGGDSGNPAFALIGGQPVLLFTHFDSPFGPNLGTLFNEVNAIMTRLGGGYQLSTVDLRDFTPAKPPTSTNRAPTAKALDIQVTGLVTNIIFEGTDPDGDPLTFATGTPPVQGILKKETETKYTYTLTSLPDTAFVDGFNYYSSDKKLTSPAVRVTLRYTPVQYNLLVTKTGLGTVTASNINCGLDCAEKYSVNTKVTLTTTPNTGYIFTGWSGDCTGTTCTVVMTKDSAVTANFAVINTAPVAQNATYTFSGNSTTVTLSASDAQNDALTYTLNTLSAPKGTLTKVNETTYTYTLKTPLPTASFTETVTYTASDGKLTSTPATVTLQYTVAAPVKHLLTVSKTGTGTITGTGISCGGDCTEQINAGSIVSLTAAPGTGYSFTRWTGDCTNTSGACSVTMDRVRNVGAVFTLTPVPDADGDGILIPTDKCPNTPADLRNQVNRAGCVRPKQTKFNTKPAVEEDIKSVQNVELGIDNVGKIKFKEPVALARDNAAIDLDTNVIIEQDKVEIKSSVVPELNKPATITLYNIDEKNPRILRDGVLCSDPQCKIESFTNGTLTFTVTGFSIYTVEETPEVTPEPEPEKKKKKGSRGGDKGTTTTTQSNEELIAQLTAQLNLLIAELNRLTGGGTLTINLYPGTRSAEVTKLQNKLSSKGYIVPATGFYGVQTTAAVKKFQISRGISPTGSVGPQTRTALNN